MKQIIIKINWLLTQQVGLNIRKCFFFLLRLPEYILDYLKFKKQNVDQLKINFKPCLHDKSESGGDVSSEYFWQDLFVSQLIFESNPKTHVDIASRIDGFVAHVASFREIEVFDIRPLKDNMRKVRFKQVDLMNLSDTNNKKYTSYTDSLSCLHVIEHFGLGRYGDNIDIHGYKKGIANMSKILKRDGILYLSTPIGKERIEFNANWIFNPLRIIDEAKKNDLIVDRIFIFDKSEIGCFRLLEKKEVEAILVNMSQESYNLCLFIFRKND
jgi:SAM-dependent methyltransferase